MIKRQYRKPGNPYKQQRHANGTFKQVPRSLTLKDKIRRKYPHRVVTTLSSPEYAKFRELSTTLGLPMTDILAYLITNHLDQLAHQASFELGQQSILDKSTDNPQENPTL